LPTQQTHQDATYTTNGFPTQGIGHYIGLSRMIMQLKAVWNALLIGFLCSSSSHDSNMVGVYLSPFKLVLLICLAIFTHYFGAVFGSKTMNGSGQYDMNDKWLGQIKLKKCLIKQTNKNKIRRMSFALFMIFFFFEKKFLSFEYFLLLWTLKQYKLAKLTPIEAGCCRPPSEAGVAQYMKTEWRVVAIFNVVLFVVL
ncbi:Tetraspanin-10, partial [Camellia lanceoleosa]